MNKKWLFYLPIVFVIFMSITYAIFCYWNIDDNNKWGTFFSFTSAFGILATIGVYFWQRNDAKKLASEVEKSILKMIISECKRVESELNHAEIVFSNLDKKNLINITSKNNGNIFIITSVNESMRSNNNYLKRIELSSIENLLGLAISTNSKYFEVIYSMMVDIMRSNEELSLWLLSDNVIYEHAGLYKRSLYDVSFLINRITTTLQ
ncbi:hypothetical protein J7315_00665 [Providencia rettgeri]|uniref:hypothetical protein n=1 Tax=Providencia rettgeri TaxID=587 RepID=UPI001B38A123|nr:hypothetical protein [Providencia rettgeri]MBQ0684593.1 hypothetical protein [Providencia rettgeri]